MKILVSTFLAASRLWCTTVWRFCPTGRSAYKFTQDVKSITKAISFFFFDQLKCTKKKAAGGKLSICLFLLCVAFCFYAPIHFDWQTNHRQSLHLSPPSNKPRPHKRKRREWDLKEKPLEENADGKTKVTSPVLGSEEWKLVNLFAYVVVTTWRNRAFPQKAATTCVFQRGHDECPPSPLFLFIMSTIEIQ